MSEAWMRGIAAAFTGTTPPQECETCGTLLVPSDFAGLRVMVECPIDPVTWHAVTHTCRKETAHE